MKDYKALNTAIIEGVGGVNNIKDVIHCATRLRFNLKNKSQASAEKLKAIPGVLGVQDAAGSYHVLIGTEVDDVYTQLVNMPEMKAIGDRKSTRLNSSH